MALFILPSSTNDGQSWKFQTHVFDPSDSAAGNGVIGTNMSDASLAALGLEFQRKLRPTDCPLMDPDPVLCNVNYSIDGITETVRRATFYLSCPHAAAVHDSAGYGSALNQMVAAVQLAVDLEADHSMPGLASTLVRGARSDCAASEAACDAFVERLKIAPVVALAQVCPELAP